MGNAKLKKIATKGAGSWAKPINKLPELIRDEDDNIIRAEYVELPTGDLMIMEYEIDPDDTELMRRIRAYENGEFTIPSVNNIKPTVASVKPITSNVKPITNNTKKPEANSDFYDRIAKLSQGNDEDESEYEYVEPYRANSNRGQTPHANANRGQASRTNTSRGQASRTNTNRGQTPRTNANRGQASRTNANRGQASRSAQKKPTSSSYNSLGKILIPAVIIMLVLLLVVIKPGKKKKTEPTNTEAGMTTETGMITDIDDNALSAYTMGDINGTGTDEVPAPVIEEPDFNPHCIDSTKPENLISSTYISVNDVTLDSIDDYKAEDEITFGNGVAYSQLDGVFTFRGNNFRSDPTFGYANITEKKLEENWSHQTGALTSNGTTWTGSGWTGQPLIVKWPKETKAHMNMYDWAKEDDDLVEVIYACLDGNIYFLDLRTGEQTRDTMIVGYTFKGAGALDPRGYPIMYVGAGFHSNQGNAKVFVINLLDCSVMYTFGNGDGFAPRSGVSFFDSSALVDAETDTLIYPGENGVIYMIKLGTNYNEAAGTLSIDPQRVVKWSYRTYRNGSQYWYGMEDSCVTYKGYLFVMDNGGDFMCLDLNTLKLVWVQDSLDDSNGSPVMSIEDGKMYLYASTSFHLGWRSSSTAPIPIWKIDAETGEIVWQTDYECQSIEDLSGGTQSTIAVGRDGLDDYIYVTVSRTGGMNNGVLACISKKDGSIKWEHEAAYAWSSPVCVYNEDGSGNVIYCSSNGKMYLIDGITGEQLDALVLSEGCIEASPAVYEDFAIVGIRACQIKGVHLK